MNPKKYHLSQKSVTYLSHKMSQDGIATNPKKIEAVSQWPRPKNVTKVRSFLGLCSYYRKFIKSFSSIAKPLSVLTEKNRIFTWTPKAENAFQTLKQRLITTPILADPDPEGNFILDTDASNFGVGAVLSQVQNGEERVIAYNSKSLNKPERRYCVTCKELLAIVSAVKHFHHYLYGKEFKIRTDHGALKWLMQFKSPEGQVARWIEVLDTYTIHIEHRLGRHHGNADALSHRPCEGTDCEQCERIERCTNEKPIYIPVRLPKSEGRTSDNKGIQESSHVLTVHGQNRNISWIERKSITEIQQAQRSDPIIGKVLRYKETYSQRPTWQEISLESPKFKTYWSNWDNLFVNEGILYLAREKVPQEEDGIL